MIDNYFTIYQKRRRALVSGVAPPGLNNVRPLHARAWQAYRNRMNQEPAWERADHYRQMRQEQGFRSIRDLARAIGEDHSRIARVLKVLELPERVLAALRVHATHPRVRAHFTEKRLRQLVRRDQGEAAILREIKRVVQGRAKRLRHPASLPALKMQQTGDATKPTLGSYSGQFGSRFQELTGGCLKNEPA